MEFKTLKFIFGWSCVRVLCFGFFVMGDVPELRLAQNCSGSTFLVFEGMAYKLRYTFPLPFSSFPLC
ncbi:hypothetical protein T07_5449 [Trichinella nelsoni]|uniref:Uncharacterized protein n=1 Tax=Trichinella nelsoni TaxID=6336 RepID=A0A0V0S677_9BILA|nr:hypothetical protein T07_5449 [Trichinella nelsoni]